MERIPYTSFSAFQVNLQACSFRQIVPFQSVCHIQGPLSKQRSVGEQNIKDRHRQNENDHTMLGNPLGNARLALLLVHTLVANIVLDNTCFDQVFCFFVIHQPNILLSPILTNHENNNLNNA